MIMTVLSAVQVGLLQLIAAAGREPHALLCEGTSGARTARSWVLLIRS